MSDVGLLFFVILAAAALGFGWRAGVEAQAVAFGAAREACERAGLQLLDGTVAFDRWRWRRGPAGLGLERTYLFDYSEDGAGRRQGFVILLGQAVELVGLGPTLVRGGMA
ncbi:MAG: DUF3301 domain-containing protein [Proteobacteria bacterium]|nr:DUF3301 domain-containing protein [Pseudomonadota bacterium]